MIAGYEIFVYMWFKFLTGIKIEVDIAITNYSFVSIQIELNI